MKSQTVVTPFYHHDGHRAKYTKLCDGYFDSFSSLLRMFGCSGALIQSTAFLFLSYYGMSSRSPVRM